ncbi:hypothetical protein TH0156_14650 [Helicobacter pylori]
MGNLASGHFKPTNNIQEQHNDRTLSPSYLLPEEFRGQNEVNRHSKQAMILKNQIIESAINIYENTKKKNAPKFKSKSYQWSLVVNTKETTTMSDLEKLAEHFEIKYGFQCYQIAIHRDEGYMDENNQPHINHHAHMEFITLKKENGKNMMRKAHLSPKKFADMQTEIAQILGMERGTDKRVSGTERIEPRKYAQMKNKERKELEAKDKELNTLKQERTDLKDKIQKQDKTINELNQFKNSSNLALDLEKSQKRIKTLESNEIVLIHVLHDKENIIQNKGRTINRLKKELKELEYNYRQNRERMVAENKRLKEQGLEKTYTQKDYEDLKKTHHQEVEELKKQIQKYKTQETYTPTKRM